MNIVLAILALLIGITTLATPRYPHFAKISYTLLGVYFIIIGILALI
jgi:hypothetical protein